AKVKDGYFQCEELEKEFAPCVWLEQNLLAFVYDRDQEYLKTIDLLHLGCLKNVRTIFKTKEFTLEIDQSIFNTEKIDYELECETAYPEQCLQFLSSETFLQKESIRFQTDSKFKRFLKYNVHSMDESLI
ncbi:hypothetical protein MJH12_01815, partial [bacterium]|nr:hypothetical protein [bacterium]